MIPFRHYHTIIILKEYDNAALPLDTFLRNYFRSKKSIGSKDRSFITDTIYHLIRWKGFIDYFIPHPSWEKRLEIYLSSFSALTKKNALPPHVKVSFPKKYFDHIVKNYSLKKALKLCAILNQKAPITIRTNKIKISPNKLFSILSKKYSLSRGKHEGAFIIKDKMNFFTLEEYKKGFFEIQDEGSQMISDLVEPSAKDLILDYCAGAGGKSLAVASKLQGTGQIFLHDIRKQALLQAKKRLKRAGIQNAQIIYPEELHKKNLLKKIDWLILDVPCSGSGTLRRNPDLKWKFSFEQLDQLIIKQKEIFHKAFRFCKPGKNILYATCSLFKEENEKQVEDFLKNYPIDLVKTLSILPQENGPDGFFAAHFVRKK